ncbi:hypothetical protein D3C74_334590 [compost metagenome]
MTRTVSASTAWTFLMVLGFTARAGAVALRTWFSEPATALASMAVPSWNSTFLRSSKSHSVSEDCFQEAASIGSTVLVLWLYLARVSKQPAMEST